jgi:hypothetical protein
VVPVVPLPSHGVPVSTVAMSVFGKYAQLADACLQKAISAASVELAEGWLRMAGSWIAMEQMRQRIAARALPQTNALNHE